jgi:hypothetical protein
MGSSIALQTADQLEAAALRLLCKNFSGIEKKLYFCVGFGTK